MTAPAANQPRRLPEGGMIDRSRRLRFTFDGVILEGHPGDTLASALIANGIPLVGRSFKYHRPRGIFAAGPEEPNALVRLGAGAAGTPNTPATMVELVDGLVAESQNRWPSLRFDLMAAAGLLSPFLGAGFYYKTFMGPTRGSWMLYERLIRRSAGMGTAPAGSDPARYETVHRHVEVLVIGAGPAGIAATLAAGAAGARVLLVEQGIAPGGSLHRDRVGIDGRPALAWVAEAIERLGRLDNVEMRTRATAFGCYDHNLVAVVERTRPDDPAPVAERLLLVRAGEVVLATGAIEQPLVFAGNDRPGVMLAGAARTYVNACAVRPGTRAVIFTNNDDAYRTALDLGDAGIDLRAVIDVRETAEGSLPAAVAARGIARLPGRSVVATHGRRQLAAIDVAPHGRPDERRRMACDLLCVSGGWSPAIQLASQRGARPLYDAQRNIFLPGVGRQKERSAGAARGTFVLADCLAEGFAAGAAAAFATGHGSGKAPECPAVDDGGPQSPSLPWWPATCRGKAFVDLQTDVTLDDVALAGREGFVSVEHLKRYTTLGMGTDQGKTGGLAGIHLMARLSGRAAAGLGTTTFRPPATPVSLGTLAGRAIGEDLAPVQRTAMDGWHRNAGALMAEHGLWMRPRAYPRTGETFAEAVSREALAVRTGAGLIDVSTLGKIELAGPDSAEFLDRIYVNGWTSLAVGKARYGVMLREDGHVLDDGTVARLGEHRYHVTTSTGHVEHVLAHLEFHLQAVWPKLRVVVTPVTECWAVMALAGPRAREVLARIADVDVSNRSLPFLGVREGRVAGVPARIFRISYSGELAYEVNVPADRGAEVWEEVIEAGAPSGLIPYGTEAMDVLRIEKGHVAGNEIDGRTTPGDLGLERMIGRKKSCVGLAALDRPGLTDPLRPALVGLEPLEPGASLRAGAQLIAAQTPKTPAAEPVAMLGHVTSAAFSPGLGHSIALALLSGGRRRIGESVYAAFPLKDECVACRVVEPVFIDPTGERPRG